jgi:hypothetical protein
LIFAAKERDHRVAFQVSEQCGCQVEESPGARVQQRWCRQRRSVRDSVSIQDDGQPACVRLEAAGDDGDLCGSDAAIQQLQHARRDPFQLLQRSAVYREDAQRPLGNGSLGRHRCVDARLRGLDLDRPRPVSTGVASVWVGGIGGAEPQRDTLRQRLEEVALRADELRDPVNLGACELQPLCPRRRSPLCQTEQAHDVEEAVILLQPFERALGSFVQLAQLGKGVRECPRGDARIAKVTQSGGEGSGARGLLSHQSSESW